MKKIILIFIILHSYKINSQTELFDYSNKNEPKEPEKYSVPYSLVKAGKKKNILDSFEVKFYSRLLFHLGETELHSKYLGFDIIRLIIMPAFQPSKLVKIIHIKDYDSLLIIIKTFDFSNHITKDMVDEPFNAPIDKKTNRIYRYKLSIKRINIKHWEEIVMQINKTNEWYISKPKKTPIPDGEMILFEEHFKNGYFFMNPWYDDSEETEFKKLIYFILRLI